MASLSDLCEVRSAPRTMLTIVCFTLGSTTQLQCPNLAALSILRVFPHDRNFDVVCGSTTYEVLSYAVLSLALPCKRVLHRRHFPTLL